MSKGMVKSRFYAKNLIDSQDRQVYCGLALALAKPQKELINGEQKNLQKIYKEENSFSLNVRYGNRRGRDVAAFATPDVCR